MTVAKPFNPLDKENLAASIERALNHAEKQPLGCVEKFYGAGVYSIYYRGPYSAYAPLVLQDSDTEHIPIYVGKADSKGKRKGGFIQADPLEDALWKRLSDHRKSIEQAKNLELDDFYCKFLVVDDLWIGLGESLLISKYAPVWNTLVDGFGNHAPGKGREKGKRSRWDTLHPGRPWADRLGPNPATIEEISFEVFEYLAKSCPRAGASGQSSVRYFMM